MSALSSLTNVAAPRQTPGFTPFRAARCRVLGHDLPRVLTTETHAQRCHRCGKSWLVFTQKAGIDDRPLDAGADLFPRVLNRGWYYGVQHRDGTVTMSLGWGRKEAEAYAEAMREVPTVGHAVVDA